MLGEEPTERMTKAERQRLEFEAERLRWQEERKKGGQTAQKAANVRPDPYAKRGVYLHLYVDVLLGGALTLSIDEMVCCPGGNGGSPG